MGIRGRSTARSALLPVALLAIALVAGCAAEPPGSPEPTESLSSTPIPADAVTAPSSRLGLDCADLVPEGLIAATVATGLVVLPYAAAVGGLSPLSYAIEQLGGTACAGTDPTAPVPVAGVGPSVPGYTVIVLPDATEQYAHYAELSSGVTNGADAAHGDSFDGACFGRGAESSCSSNILVGNTWIEVHLTGIDVDAAASDADVAVRVAPLIESIVTTVADAPVPGSLWTPSADTEALPDDCAVYATEEEVRSAFERTEDLWVGPAGGGGWSLSAGAWTMSGTQRCAWLLDGYDIAVLGMAALPGGAWAYEAATSLTIAGDLPERTEESIPGVERSSFGCTTSTVTCTLDTVMGGNWVQFSASSAEGEADLLRDSLIQIAAAAAARVSG